MKGRGVDGWSARGYMLSGFSCVLLLVGGLGGWSATARLEGAVVSRGQVRVETRRQVVQHPDGGVIGAILVREGDIVAPGDVLVRLDGTVLQSEIALLESELYEVMARRARLEAEQVGRSELVFDPDLVEAAGTSPQIRAQMDGQLELSAARLGTFTLGKFENRKVHATIARKPTMMPVKPIPSMTMPSTEAATMIAAIDPTISLMRVFRFCRRKSAEPRPIGGCRRRPPSRW